MSKPIADINSPARIAERASAVLTDVLWRQWAIINRSALVKGQSRTACVIDPEALVLASTALTDRERRFVDLLGWYAEHASWLLSVQRTRTLVDILPVSPERVGWFGHWAVQLGSDRRWKGLAEEPKTAEPRRGKGSDVLRLDSPATLRFRLRAGFGVGVKADLLTYLLCLRGEDRSVAVIADAIGYSEKTVRIALQETRVAGFVEETSDYPARYGTRLGFTRPFIESLHGHDVEVPQWCYWAQVFAFLLHVAQWKDEPDLSDNVYLASSRARDLYEDYEGVFRRLGRRMPRPEPHPGPAYLSVFDEFVSRLELWLKEEAHG